MVSTPPLADPAVVAAESGGRLAVRISNSMRPYIAAALCDYTRAMRELPTSRFRTKEDMQACLDVVDAFRDRLDRATGPVTLSGPQQLICDLVKAATRTATDDLDSRVEKAAGGEPGRDPWMQIQLKPKTHKRLRIEASAAATLIEAWAACDALRDTTDPL